MEIILHHLEYLVSVSPKWQHDRSTRWIHLWKDISLKCCKFPKNVFFNSNLFLFIRWLNVRKRICVWARLNLWRFCSPAFFGVLVILVPYECRCPSMPIGILWLSRSRVDLRQKLLALREAPELHLFLSMSARSVSHRSQKIQKSLSFQTWFIFESKSRNV